MDTEIYLSSAKKFSREVVQFEKKKAVLPLVITLLLLGSVVYGLHLRENEEVDEQTFDTLYNSHLNGTELIVSHEYFPNESGLETKQKLKSESHKISEIRWEELDELRLYFKWTQMFGKLSIMSPGSILAEEKGYPPVNTKNGYVRSKELVENTAFNYHRMAETKEIIGSANKSRLSYQDFQRNFDKLRKASYDEAKDSLVAQRKTEGGYVFPGMVQLDYYNLKLENIQENYRNDSWKEVQFYHFIPTFIATFIAYYLAIGFILAAFRNFSYISERLMLHLKPDTSIAIGSVLSLLSVTAAAFLFSILFLENVLFTSAGAFFVYGIVVGIIFIASSKLIDSENRWLKRSIATFIAANTLIIGYSMSVPHLSKHLVSTGILTLALIATSLNAVYIERKIEKDLKKY
jgi:hypothetical protein